MTFGVLLSHRHCPATDFFDAQAVAEFLRSPFHVIETLPLDQSNKALGFNKAEMLRKNFHAFYSDFCICHHETKPSNVTTASYAGGSDFASASRRILIYD